MVNHTITGKFQKIKLTSILLLKLNTKNTVTEEMINEDAAERMRKAMIIEIERSNIICKIRRLRRSCGKLAILRSSRPKQPLADSPPSQCTCRCVSRACPVSNWSAGRTAATRSGGASALIDSKSGQSAGKGS